MIHNANGWQHAWLLNPPTSEQFNEIMVLTWPFLVIPKNLAKLNYESFTYLMLNKTKKKQTDGIWRRRSEARQFHRRPCRQWQKATRASNQVPCASAIGLVRHGNSRPVAVWHFVAPSHWRMWPAGQRLPSALAALCFLETFFSKNNYYEKKLCFWP